MAKGYKDVLADYGERIVSRIKEGLVNDDTMATGEAMRSVVYSSSDTQLTITYNKSVAAVDRGLRPGEHSPNWQSIVRWMQAKGSQKFGITGIGSCHIAGVATADFLLGSRRSTG